MTKDWVHGVGHRRENGQLVYENQDGCYGDEKKAGMIISERFCVNFWQLSRDGTLHNSDMSHATKASPKPYFRAP